MSSFACKQLLRHEIISNDTWFYNAEEMAGFLKQYFKDDSTKEYLLVDLSKNSDLRKNERDEHKI